MKKKAFGVLLSLALLINIIPVNAEEASQTSSENFEVQTLDVLENDFDAYYKEAVIQEDGTVVVDGEVSDPEQVQEGLSEAIETDTVEEFVEESTLEVIGEDEGNLVVTSPYQTKHIIVNTAYLDSDYGASEVIRVADDIDQYILQFQTEEETQAAFEQMEPLYDCCVDPVLFADDMLEAVDEYGVEQAWGYDYMGFGMVNAQFDGEVRIAVVDSGYDFTKGLYADRVSKEDCYDATSTIYSEGDVNMKDIAYHGTKVADIIAQNTPSNVEIIPIRFYNDSGVASASALAAGMKYAFDEGCQVINYSSGDRKNSGYLDPYIKKALEQGIVFTCAAGNYGSTTSVDNVYPANAVGTIAVGSLDSDSERDWESCYGSALDFVAPGERIEYGLTKISGTSFATPYVSAAFAVLMLAHPDLGYDALYQKAVELCEDLGDPGRDDYYGNGCILLSEDPDVHDCGNSLTEVEAKDSTCTEAGNIAYYQCDLCNRLYLDADAGQEITEDEVILEPGHLYSDEYTVDVPATYTEEGSESRHCTREGCDATTDERSIPVLACTDHQWVAGDVIREATGTEEGSQEYVCSVCGKTTTKEIPKLTEPFEDVNETDWYYENVVSIYNKGLMTGTSEKTFDPSSPMTRAQFAVVLYRMEGKPEVTYKNTFADVPDHTWYSNEVTWAADAGIVTGYDNGYYGPDDLITREQMAVMMYRYGKYKGYDVSASQSFESFQDAASVSGYAEEAMRWCVAEGIIQGKYGTMLDPLGCAIRAEAATIINRFDERYAQ